MAVRATWENDNLWDHYYRHPAGDDEACWSDLLGQTGRRVTKDQYEDESERVVNDRWLEYTAEFECRAKGYIRRAGEEGVYYEERRYHIDDKLLTTVTSFDGRDIVTCFHEHFDGRHVPQAEQPPVGELRETYKENLYDWQQIGRVKKYREIHDGSK